MANFTSGDGGGGSGGGSPSRSDQLEDIFRRVETGEESPTGETNNGGGGSSGGDSGGSSRSSGGSSSQEETESLRDKINRNRAGSSEDTDLSNRREPDADQSEPAQADTEASGNQGGRFVDRAGAAVGGAVNFVQTKTREVRTRSSEVEESLFGGARDSFGSFEDSAFGGARDSFDSFEDSAFGGVRRSSPSTGQIRETVTDAFSGEAFGDELTREEATRTYERGKSNQGPIADSLSDFGEDVEVGLASITSDLDKQTIRQNVQESRREEAISELEEQGTQPKGAPGPLSLVGPKGTTVAKGYLNAARGAQASKVAKFAQGAAKTGGAAGGGGGGALRVATNADKVLKAGTAAAAAGLGVSEINIDPQSEQTGEIEAPTEGGGFDQAEIRAPTEGFRDGGELSVPEDPTGRQSEVEVVDPNQNRLPEGLMLNTNPTQVFRRDQRMREEEKNRGADKDELREILSGGGRIGNFEEEEIGSPTIDDAPERVVVERDDFAGRVTEGELGRGNVDSSPETELSDVQQPELNFDTEVGTGTAPGQTTSPGQGQDTPADTGIDQGDIFDVPSDVRTDVFERPANATDVFNTPDTANPDEFGEPTIDPGNYETVYSYSNGRGKKKRQRDLLFDEGVGDESFDDLDGFSKTFEGDVADPGDVLSGRAFEEL